MIIYCLSSGARLLQVKQPMNVAPVIGFPRSNSLPTALAVYDKVTLGFLRAASIRTSYMTA